jgi:predicted secreted protein
MCQLVPISALLFAFQISPAIVVSSADNGKTLKVKTGQSISVRLPVQRGTGYSWQFPKPQALFTVKEEKDISHKSVRPEAEEMQTFLLSVLKSGEAEVLFQYRRPWEETAAPAKTFRFKVEAKK